MSGKRKNGAGTVYRRKSDGRWLAAWTDPATGKRRFVYAASEADGYRRLEEAQARIAAGRADGTKRIRLVEFAGYWERELLPYATSQRGRSTLAAGSQRLYKDAINLHVVPRIGNLPLADITPADVENTLRHMVREGKSDSYVQITHKAMVRLFKEAEKARHIDRNPARGIEIPAGKKAKQKVVPNAEQIKALLKVEDLRTRALIAMLVYPGLRITEALTVTWPDVDLGNRTLTVMGKGSKPRTLAISQGLAEILGAWRTEQARQRLAAIWWDEADYVLTSDAGTRWDGDNARKVFNRFARPIVPGITPHSLRHANATLLIAQGVSTEVVSKVLGHTDSRLTSTVYVHLAESMSREASAAMDRVLGDEAAAL